MRVKTTMTELKQSITEYSYAKYILGLTKLCNIHRLLFEIIGYEWFEKIGINYPIYRITVNPKARINFGIVAGVHGYELAGPLTIPELLRKKHQYLKDEIRYLIYPLINPTGFDLKRRNDDDNVKLNTLNKKLLHSKNYREIQAFYKDIKGKKFRVFLDLHEDVDEYRYYVYIFEKKLESVYRKIIKNAARHCKILRKKELYGAPVSNGLIINVHDRSIEDYLFLKNRAVFSLCPETPGKIDIKKRIKINLETIKILSDNICK